MPLAFHIRVLADIGRAYTLSLFGLVSVVFSLTAGNAVAAAKPKAAAGGGGGMVNRMGKPGCIELGLSGLYDMDPDDATTAYVELKLGYFPIESFGFGLTTLNGTTRDGQRGTSGAFIEYDLVTNMRLVPYGGFAFEHRAPPTKSDGKDARVFELFAGGKFTIAPSAALSLTLNIDYATHSVLGPPDDRKRRNRDFDLGVWIMF